jgi:hypothetical protein
VTGSPTILETALAAGLAGLAGPAAGQPAQGRRDRWGRWATRSSLPTPCASSLT